MKKERKKQVQKILAIFLVMMLVIPTFFSVYGAINENYKGSRVFSGLNVSGNESSNILSKAVFWLINTIASIGEYLLSSFANVLASANKGDTDSTIMPWADAIIYNGVPALDVNFINPSEGSFSGIISTVIAKLYYTIFSISITFFTVAVLVMAIKLATTAIAAEKARYKESVANFIISLILIFSIHYFISFCFYLNESLVKVAFAIGENQLSGEVMDVGSNAKERFNDLIDEINNDPESQTLIQTSKTKPGGAVEVTADVSNLKKFADFSKQYILDGGAHEKILGYLSVSVLEIINDDNGNGTRKADASEKLAMIDCMVELIYSHCVVKGSNSPIFDEELKNKTYENSWNAGKDGDKLYSEISKIYNSLLHNDDSTLVNNGGYHTTESEDEFYLSVYDIDDAALWNKDYFDLEKRIMSGIDETISTFSSSYVEGGTIESYGTSVVSQLAVYFRINRFDSDGEISLVGVIVYTIFVFQSIMYFLAYLKRFFYIIILSFFGPFLVLYDFLAKSMGQNANTLSKWLREFCALVFIQSLQAFLLAMIASLIVSINGEIQNLDPESAQGLAVINIIALAAMSKLEQLVSDMIGLKSSISDLGLKGGAKMGAHGLAGGIATMAALRRLGDNGKKMIGGVRGIAAGRREQKNALAEKNRKMNQYAELLAQGGGAGGPEGEGEAGEGALGGLGGGAGAGNGGGAAGAAGGRLPSLKDKHKYQDMLANCDAKIMEARNKKKAAIYQIASGVFETAGSVAGFAAGGALAGTMHAAAGDFSLGDVLSDAVKGAGVGDVLGEAALSIPTGVASFGKDVKAGSGKNALIREIKQKQEIIKNAYERAGFDVSDLE